MPLCFIPEASVLFPDRRVLGPDRDSLPTGWAFYSVLFDFNALIFISFINQLVKSLCHTFQLKVLETKHLF